MTRCDLSRVIVILTFAFTAVLSYGSDLRALQETIEGAKTWSTHQALLRNARSSPSYKESYALYRAYRTVYRSDVPLVRSGVPHDPSAPLGQRHDFILAGLADSWLHLQRLESLGLLPKDLDCEGGLLNYIRTELFKSSSPECLASLCKSLTAGLLEYPDFSTPPRMVTQLKNGKLQYNADGSVVKLAVFDSKAQEGRRKSLEANTLKRIRSIGPKTPTFAWIIAYEMPSGIARLRELESVTRKYPEMQTVASYFHCWNAAQELHDRASEQE